MLNDTAVVNTKPSDRQLCFKHADIETPGTSVVVSCSRPLTGNVIRVEMKPQHIQSVLCELKGVGGERDYFMLFDSFSKN